MASVSRFLTTKLRLKVNEAKSAVARPEERKFLGFSISNDGSERRIAPKALDTFKTRIREQTRRTRTAVQRCRIGWTESSVQQLQAEAKRLIGEGFPNRRMSDSWGGNRLGGCRDCICAADGLAGRRS
jgi:hypothetical protein